MDIDTCRICGGDGQIGNAFGGETTRCPSCHGTGRRSFEPLMRDVTKTKPSHHHPASQAEAKAKANIPTTHSGMQLARELAESKLPDNVKARLTREIAEYEGTHGKCTQTFIKKIHKQIRASESK